ncbi:MAG: hypothetical protein V7L26_32360 [Nostoc sp.]|uniref:hypothetical protein n=1 Tax=Nostoc sp. TaxID=1180 RepID=UPI002FFB4413
MVEIIFTPITYPNDRWQNLPHPSLLYGDRSPSLLPHLRSSLSQRLNCGNINLATIETL